MLALGVIAGVAAASWLPVWLAFGLAAAACCRSLPLAIGMAIGAYRIMLSPLVPPEADLADLAGRERTVRGTIDSFPDYRQKYQQFVVEGTAEGKEGRTLVQTDPLLEFSPGDRVAVTGLLTEPRNFEGFDYRSFLAKDGVHSIMRRADVSIEGSERTLARTFYAIRKRWVLQTERTFPEPAAGFSLGILIGERSTLSDAHIAAFRKTGTTHILALSGFNVSIIITAIIWVLGRKPAALTASLGLIAAFVLLVGPSATVVRAALMGGFLLLGQLFGRPQVAMYVAVITAAAMLVMQPHALRYDLGFDLSFLATLGILWLEPDIRRHLTRIPELARGIVSATFAAGVTTAPLIALTFGTASLVSPLANLLVVPAIPLLMLGGFVSVMISFVSSELAALPAALTAAATVRLLGGIGWLAGLPAASVTFAELKGIAAILLSVVAAAGIFQLKRPRHA